MGSSPTAQTIELEHLFKSSTICYYGGMADTASLGGAEGNLVCVQIALVAPLIKRSDVFMKTKDLSKYLSLILRHKPEVIGITLDEHGWANVEDLINGISKTNTFNMQMLEEIVSTDEKQRYSFNEDKTLIRANQGHSVQVDVELEKVTPPRYLWHGTVEKYVESIDKNGLIPKSRLYVHLSSDKETAIKVGSRHGNPVIYRVRSFDMTQDGFEFYLSKNGVWLTDTVPAKFLDKIPNNF